MCLIAIGWHAHPDSPLVVAANRDEWRDRPAAPAHWWSDHPSLLAGRDPHHIAEAEYKAFARAFRQAKALDPLVEGIPSTKGAL